MSQARTKSKDRVSTSGSRCHQGCACSASSGDSSRPNLLDEAVDAVRHRPLLPESDLFSRDLLVPLHEVAQRGENHPLDELAEVLVKPMGR